MFKLDLEKAGEPEIKLSTPIGSQKRQNKMNYGGKKKIVMTQITMMV